MDKLKLRREFKNESGYNWENTQNEPDIDYVEWLEQKLIKLLTVPIIDCGTCKHNAISKYVEPCHGCRDNDSYDHYESDNN
jgi:hypothetical protein